MKQLVALVDCDAFYVSCERMFAVALRNRPVLVLSNNDGCVVARSKEVKQLKIAMGTPYFQIRHLVCKLANYDSGILGIMLLSKQASEAALYAGGVVHLPELPAVPPAELSKFRYHHSQVYSSPSGVLTRGLSWRSVRQPATAVVSF